jgi:hypothetical protein
MNAICAIINIMITVINRDYKEVLAKSLQDQLWRNQSTILLATRTTVESKINYVVIFVLPFFLIIFDIFWMFFRFDLFLMIFDIFLIIF